MSCYFTGKSWRYDFWFRGQRYTGAKGFQTKWEAERAQALRKEELRSGIKKGSEQTQAGLPQAEQTAMPQTEDHKPEPVQGTQAPSVRDEAPPAFSATEQKVIPFPRPDNAEQANGVSFTETPAIATDMAFLDLLNKRLDWVRKYRSITHYNCYISQSKRWIELWGDKLCSQITDEEIVKHLEERRKISVYTANKDRRYLRSVFRHGIFTLKCKLLNDPSCGIPPYPENKKRKYVPSVRDLDKVIAVAKPADQDYLWAIRETVGRVGEINRMVWDDVDFENCTVVLYTRKTRTGDLEPRTLGMTTKLLEVLDRLYAKRDLSKPWVFWHRYWSRKAGKIVCGPYDDRKKLMRGLCKKAGVRYFRFHPIRHQGASVMAADGASLPAIQKRLGHARLSTTEIYLHSIGEDDRRAADHLEAGRERRGSK
jgi:integrase